MILHWLQHAHQSDQYLAVNEATECVISNVRAGAESISISIFICSKCPEIHTKRLFNCEQYTKAETSTNSCPTNKLVNGLKIPSRRREQN